MPTGYRTLIIMTVALAAALFQHYVEPIPAVDPEVWNIVLPIIAIGMRLITKKAVPFKDITIILWRIWRYRGASS